MNGQINLKFLASIDSNTRYIIIDEISKNYKITSKQVLEEITHDESENLLDYLTGSTRIAVSLLMKRRK